MDKVDYKKQFKRLYLPKRQPVLITVPPLRFAMLDGQGDPNGEVFAEAVAALYSFSYAVKMSYKSTAVPDGYYDYTVFPLEGVWDLVDKAKTSADKSNYAYTMMIRQPDFLTAELAARFIDEVKKKKPNEFLDQIRLEDLEEGSCCQMLHLGSYDDEPASFAQMEAFCSEHGYGRSDKTHREIYLSDPRRTETAKLKTVLRIKVTADQ
ncbi:GyrI-like domain-containing protein [Acetobacterium sp.]|uniref:GyrI-like domain-containing protein n=1 Tax=Acetobacterium sp. TaxID=1872094 RepID=UPI0027197E08|nr:GyrI-like domain-containing protein [Acetobacterium sp.]MDO9490735.1 GyrI-like domain-containing protein [Acetobacterium sp.]